MDVPDMHLVPQLSVLRVDRICIPGAYKFTQLPELLQEVIAPLSS